MTGVQTCALPILGQKGKDIGIGFEYDSLNNKEWLATEQFLDMVKRS